MSGIRGRDERGVAGGKRIEEFTLIQTYHQGSNSDRQETAERRFKARLLSRNSTAN